MLTKTTILLSIMLPLPLIRFCRFTIGYVLLASTLFAQIEDRSAYEALLAEPWQEAFHDSGQNNWQDQWFVDGHKATLSNSTEGMFFASGPIAGDNGSHSVLWTNESFTGDLKLEFNYTRMDSVENYVCIIYLYATGAGPEPYVEDIASWKGERQVPYMKTYFDHMNLLHISFAAFDNRPDVGKESAYIRARRYPRSLFDNNFNRMALKPDYQAVGLFEPGVPHHVTVIKRGTELYMNVSNPNEERLFYWDLTDMPPLDHGRIGFRHMHQRAAMYKDVTVSQIPTQE